MKIDQWTAFVETIADDQEALAVFRGGDASKIVAMAQSKGFSFSEQDISDARILGESGELSESLLEGISGAARIGGGMVP